MAYENLQTAIETNFEEMLNSLGNISKEKIIGDFLGLWNDTK